MVLKRKNRQPRNLYPVKDPQTGRQYKGIFRSTKKNSENLSSGHPHYKKC